MSKDMVYDTNDMEFVQFVTETLIPDLRESGSLATADDIERLVGIIETKDSEIKDLVDEVASADERLKDYEPLCDRVRELEKINCYLQHVLSIAQDAARTAGADDHNDMCKDQGICFDKDHKDLVEALELKEKEVRELTSRCQLLENRLADAYGRPL